MDHKKFSIIILCPDRNVSGLKITTSSIKNEFGDMPFMAIVPGDTLPSDERELARLCPVYKAGKTITSLIDTGISHSLTEWDLVIISGGWVRKNVMKKYQYFAKSEKDILFPVVDRKFSFDEGSISGIFLNKSVIRDIGWFGDEGASLDTIKLFWALDAIKKGYNFKAIVGANFL